MKSVNSAQHATRSVRDRVLAQTPEVSASCCARGLLSACNEWTCQPCERMLLMTYHSCLGQKQAVGQSSGKPFCGVDKALFPDLILCPNLFLFPHSHHDCVDKVPGGQPWYAFNIPLHHDVPAHASHLQYAVLATSMCTPSILSAGSGYPQHAADGGTAAAS